MHISVMILEEQLHLCCMQMLTYNHHSHWAPVEQFLLPRSSGALKGGQIRSAEFSWASPRCKNRTAVVFLWRRNFHLEKKMGFPMLPRSVALKWPHKHAVKDLELAFNITLCPRIFSFFSLGSSSSLKMQDKVCRSKQIELTTIFCSWSKVT